MLHRLHFCAFGFRFGLVHIVRHLVATEKRRGSNNEEATPTQCLSSVNHAHYGKQGLK